MQYLGRERKRSRRTCMPLSRVTHCTLVARVSDLRVTRRSRLRVLRLFRTFFNLAGHRSDVLVSSNPERPDRPFGALFSGRADGCRGEETYQRTIISLLVANTLGVPQRTATGVGVVIGVHCGPPHFHPWVRVFLRCNVSVEASVVDFVLREAAPCGGGLSSCFRFRRRPQRSPRPT